MSDSEIKELKYYFDSFTAIAISRIDNKDLNSVKNTLKFLEKTFKKILSKGTEETYRILFDEKQPAQRQAPSYIQDISSYEIEDIDPLPVEDNVQLPIIELYKEPDYLFIKIYNLLFDLCEYAGTRGLLSIPQDILDTIWNLLITTISVIDDITLKRKISDSFFNLYAEITRLGFLWEKKDEKNGYHNYIDGAAYEWYRDLLFHSTLLYTKIFEVDAENNFLNCIEIFLKTESKEHFDKFIEFIQIGSQNRIEITNSNKIENILVEEHDYKIYDIINNDLGSIRTLDENSIKLITYKELQEWEEQYNIEIEKLSKHIKEKITPFNAIHQNNIRQARYNFLANNYRITIVHIVIYLLKHKQYEKVKRIIGDNLNSNIWNLSKIYFSEFEDLLKLLSLKNTVLRIRNYRNSFYENEKYNYQYFIILLMYSNQSGISSLKQVIRKEKKPDKVSFYLYEFKKMFEYNDSNFGLVKSDYDRFIELINFLHREGIDKNAISSKINSIINEYENHLAELPSMLSVDSDLVKNFKSNFEEKYKINSTFRNIIGYTNQETNESSKDVKMYGISTLLDKAMFIKNWHAQFIGMQKFGIEFADIENTIIGRELFDSSTQIEERQQNISDLIEKYVTDEHIIIGFNFFFYYEIFRNDNSFIPEWNMKDETKESEKLPKGFQGLYKGKNRVYTVRDSTQEKRILIIRKKHLNFLKQYNPISEEQDTPIPRLELVANHVGFSIIDYTGENGDKLIKYQLKQNENWLSEFNNDEEKTNYLKTKVWFRALQKFKVEIPSDFDAITIIVKN